MPPAQTCLPVHFFTHTFADGLKSETSTKSMCEQIIKYDCGHMCRRTIRCIEHQPKHHHSVTCFSGLAYAHEQDHHDTAKFERRAALCPMCEEKGKEDEIYQNSIRRTSAPPIETKKDLVMPQEKAKGTVTKMRAIAHCATSTIVLNHVLKNVRNHALNNVPSSVLSIVWNSPRMMGLRPAAVEDTAQATSSRKASN
ncbi:hypothetical protein TrVGV298_000786 [Trichoderma virens]|nr:hypothetical protein TrVGV298_000786 [Trichoderma virens]